MRRLFYLNVASMLVSLVLAGHAAVENDWQWYFYFSSAAILNGIIAIVLQVIYD